MADEAEQGDDDVPSGPSSDAAAVALSLTGASRARADAFLEDQSRYLRLQMEDLHEQRDLTLSHLRWRRWSDWMRVSWQALICLFLLAVAICLVIAIGNALRAKDLIIDPISVPVAVADRGLSGEAAANQILARLNQMSNNTISYTQAGGDYRDTSGNDIKVVIPQTGISIGQLNQYLRSWLGNETHIGGAILQNGSRLSLSMRIGAFAIPVIEVRDGDLDRLMQRAAENVFAQDRPLRFADYLLAQGRFPEALRILKPLASHGSNDQRGSALSSWGQVLLGQGNVMGAIEKLRAAAALGSASGGSYLAFVDAGLGHDEAALKEFEAGLRHWNTAHTVPLGTSVSAVTGPAMSSNILALQGDFQGAAADQLKVIADAPANEPTELTITLATFFLARDHDMTAATDLENQQMDDVSDKRWTDFIADILSGRFKEAEQSGAAANAATTPTSPLAPYLTTALWCDWAWAMAEAGDFKDANARIAQTSPASDQCALDRGKIAAAENDINRAAYWFGLVERRAPDVPFADTAWGTMLLRHGRLDDAIEKFDAAHRKGQRFADPLELWGEALIADNRADLAVAKFEEAARLAPRWARLHLKWAEALLWAGSADDARKQLVLAAGLDLSNSERLALSRDIIVLKTREGAGH